MTQELFTALSSRSWTRSVVMGGCRTYLQSASWRARSDNRRFLRRRARGYLESGAHFGKVVIPV